MNNKRLTRDRNRKIFGGVCAGLARYFGWEVDKMRLAYILISVLSAAFPGLLVYLILWVVMPED